MTRAVRDPESADGVKVTRTVMRYHGGKFAIRKWIIAHHPPCRIYVEPFGGAASVLLSRPRVYSEVYNDLDGEIVNVFRVLRDPAQAKDLMNLLYLTPYSREEFRQAYIASNDTVEQARRYIVRSFMGFGSASATQDCAEARGFRAPAVDYIATPTGCRAASNRSGTVAAHDWAHYPDALRGIVERLRGVTIENRDAVEVIRQQDHIDTLFYCDPPYPGSTRTSRNKQYRHEMSDDDHRALAEVLRSVVGKVVLSGYPCELYDRELYPDWKRFERRAMADGARARTEVLWLNPAAEAGMAQAVLI